MPKTVIERSQSPSPDVTVFCVTGTLGFHQKDTLIKLFDECKKRQLNRVILDVEGLTSLGGGCAQIIRDEAAAGKLAIGVARAKPTVLKFLKDDQGHLVIAESVDEAAAGLAGGPRASDDSVRADAPTAAENTRWSADAAPPPSPEGENATDADPAQEAAGSEEPGEPPDTAESTAPDAVPIEAAPGASREPVPPADGTNESSTADPPEQDTAVSSRELRKRIIQYNTLFSLASDFYRINDRKALLELFLLTTIAQVGVESAVFLELNEGYFTPAASKGLEADELKGLAIWAEWLNLKGWMDTLDPIAVSGGSLPDEVKAPLLSFGCSYIAPFVVRGEFRGIVAMGAPVRPTLDEGSVGFLKIMINQAAIAYESTRRFEEEKKRTLGLVQTLISLIEENTLARGNSNLISGYTHALAKKLHYPEEYKRDLMYGTVLRDIGMIRVSDLIVRSPRQLMPEEWEIIKRHPTDGGEMLRRMKFSDHAIRIVESHHERFNGEGYPRGLQGKQIPLGSRIVSVVESYAAMLQDRPTRPALTSEEALNTLQENWGMRYDPDVVRALLETIEEELRTGEKSNETYFELLGV